MALARLTKQCHECPFVETCEHKEMEALGYLPEPIMADVKVPVTADIAAPILRETVSRVVDGKKEQRQLDIQINQAIALVNRNHRRKKYDTERLSAGSSSHSPRRFTA